MKQALNLATFDIQTPAKIHFRCELLFIQRKGITVLKIN
jgi:hypothetical protein